MDLTQIIGFLAGFGTTFAALPDLIAMLKRRSSVGMNPRMAAITGTFQILWVIYGTLISSRSIVMWNVIAVVTDYLTLGHICTFGATKCDPNFVVRFPGLHQRFESEPELPSNDSDIRSPLVYNCTWRQRRLDHNAADASRDFDAI
jgi:uncharacterized protein with PQ loop repeat